jgi:hypothetical protein
VKAPPPGATWPPAWQRPAASRTATVCSSPHCAAGRCSGPGRRAAQGRPRCWSQAG